MGEFCWTKCSIGLYYTRKETNKKDVVRKKWEDGVLQIETPPRPLPYQTLYALPVSPAHARSDSDNLIL